ncbi:MULTISPECIES: DUF2332 domain-containing protein [Sphingopyxis]|uniref:DUF2332 domain-containing protein n=1 Tax=Sphingopyxis TaxID=165697 RepID=UPI0008688290|nr:MULTISPECIES: DUF2332 domain-containing protein [Sphingopyxis]APW72404.1 hypothetical protein BWD40_05600 [Sphingopyxis granuli]AVA13244.1 DUF2332 domain-containing protein [Sphingopyxis sp. MG]ODU30256.1 MAG: hypothetical protein ABS88_06335 [Sphingopyxis sp. SCN 67-31]QUM71750.1 DUF2332 domain-containing protein [Sphingopyxis granuli]
MSERYEFIDIGATGADAVRTAFRNQVAYCRAADAPVTARIVAALATLIDAPATGFARRMAEWQGAPLADALPLRAAGGLHALHLSGAAPELAPIYADADDINDAAIVAGVVQRQEAALLPWLDGPPQTNEAGRSSNFIAAMLWLAEQGLPPRFDCLEIGSSAGINLMIDRYHYDLGGVHVGPRPGAMAFTPEWQGNHPPQLPIEIAALKGCDVAPVDLTDPAQALQLKAYIWPEHAVRFARMEAAIAAARERTPDLVRATAADFVEAELKKPQAAGTTRVLMHSIVWQYVPENQQMRVTTAMEEAGAEATPDRPLAWIALEANRTVHHHELVVRHWPGGEAGRLLARSHPHGAWIEWTG